MTVDNHQLIVESTNPGMNGLGINDLDPRQIPADILQCFAIAPGDSPPCIRECLAQSFQCFKVGFTEIGQLKRY